MMVDINQFLTGDLAPGEDILWCGQPQQGLLLRRSEGLWIPVSLLTGLLVFPAEGWLVSLLWKVVDVHDYSTAGMAILFVLGGIVLLGLLFVLAAGYLLLGRFAYDSLRRRKTFYALTNRRVIICSTILNRRIRSIPLDRKLKMTLVNNTGGRGSLYLSAEVVIWWMILGPSWWLPIWPDVEVYHPPFLERIENAGELYQQINKLIV